jgi:hypothetical protein
LIEDPCAANQSKQEESGLRSRDLNGDSTREADSLTTATKRKVRTSSGRDLKESVIIECFAREVLGYQRVSQVTLGCLAKVLRKIERSNRTLKSVGVNQEDEHLGPPNVIRGIQLRLLQKGYLRKASKRSGDINIVTYIYNPFKFIRECGHYENTSPTPEMKLQLLDRMLDGEVETLTSPLSDDDLDFIL